MTDSTDRIRELNDRARQSFRGCRVAITQGIAALGHDAVYAILARIKAYDDFTADNDPYHEWRAPIGWSSLIVNASWVSGPSERCFPEQADDSPMSCAA